MKRAKSLTRNRSTIIGVLCGILCALCVAVYVFQVDEQAQAAQSEMLAKYGGEQVEVCVARRDITAGETISESDIEIKKWVTSLLPANAVINKSDAVGKQLGSTVLAGEVISSSRFGFDSEKIEVPDGYSAVSVPAQDVQAVGGALAPGMRTDVFAVGSNSTTKIASDVLVLATSASEDSLSKTSSAWITLAISPSKVEEMVAAAENLQLYFALPGKDASAANQLNETRKDSSSSAKAEAESESSASSKSSSSSSSSTNGSMSSSSSDTSQG